MNRYGEKAAKRPKGVETVSSEQYRPEWNPDLVATRLVQWVVESERHVWQVANRGANPNSPAPLGPWTCVNNCTQGEEASALRLDFLRGSGGENCEKPRTGLMTKNIDELNDVFTGLQGAGDISGQATKLINALPGALDAMPPPQACYALVRCA